MLSWPSYQIGSLSLRNHLSFVVKRGINTHASYSIENDQIPGRLSIACWIWGSMYWNIWLLLFRICVVPKHSKFIFFPPILWWGEYMRYRRDNFVSSYFIEFCTEISTIYKHIQFSELSQSEHRYVTVLKKAYSQHSEIFRCPLPNTTPSLLLKSNHYPHF